MKVLLLHLTSIICAAAAAYLCYKGIEGWGWFLFAAIITTYSFETSGNKEESEE